jgi:hypothetical protein
MRFAQSENAPNRVSSGSPSLLKIATAPRQLHASVDELHSIENKADTGLRKSLT